MQKTTFLLDDDFEHDRFVRYMQGAGWTMKSRDVNGPPDAAITEEIWTTEKVYVAVHYIDNPQMVCKAIVVQGRDIVGVVSELVPRFGGATPDELVEAVEEAETVRQLVAALLRLAVGFKDSLDDDIFDIYKRYSKDDESKVRAAVIQSVLHTGWPRGVDLVKEMAANDSSPALRDFAAEVHAALTKARPTEE